MYYYIVENGDLDIFIVKNVVRENTVCVCVCVCCRLAGKESGVCLSVCLGLVFEILKRC